MYLQGKKIKIITAFFFHHFIEFIHLSQYKLVAWLNVYVISQINAPQVDACDYLN